MASQSANRHQQYVRHARFVMLMAAIAALAAIAQPRPLHAAPCGNSASGFKRWVEDFRREAIRRGIAKRTVSRALDGVSYNRRIIRLDRGQRSFKQSFARFYARRASPALMGKARRMLRRHAATLRRIEKRYGVPGAVVVTIWGMETYFGRLGGKMSIIRSLATLAYDCRRSDFFKKELIAALQILDRGDMSTAQMRGGWAGEIGQAQFLASSYMKYAVDFDGDGRRDLIRSVPDVLASTANFLKQKGWLRGADWHPGSANYAVLKEWNRATVYQRTIAKASRILAGRR